MVLPTWSPWNCCCAASPTITSRTAGSNMRPSTRRISGRTSNARRPTPRRVTLESEPSLIFGRLTITTASAEAIGLPSALRRTPALSMIVRTLSRVSALDSSALEPPRSTIARSGRPLPATV